MRDHSSVNIGKPWEISTTMQHYLLFNIEHVLSHVFELFFTWMREDTRSLYQMYLYHFHIISNLFLSNYIRKVK